MTQLTLDAVEKLLEKQTKILADKTEVLGHKIELLSGQVGSVANKVQALDAKIDAVSDELSEMIRFITKEAAHKDDLKALATKEELKTLATKDDLKALATKEELKTLSSQMDKRFSDVDKRFAEQGISLNFIESQIVTLRKDLEQLSKRTKEDDNAFVKEILKLKNRIEHLEKQFKKLKAVQA